MNLAQFLIGVAADHDILVYGLIMSIAIVGGPIVALACGFLLKAGALSFVPAYLCLMASDIIGDMIWYRIGYRAGVPFIGRFGRYFSITEKNVETMQRIFGRYHDWILIISKLTTGFGFAPVVLFTAGFVKVPFRRYITINICGQFFWTALLLGVGFFLGNLYTAAGAKLNLLSIIASSVVIFLCLFGLGKYLVQYLIKRFS